MSLFIALYHHKYGNNVTEWDQGVSGIHVKPSFIHTVYLIDMVINKNLSLTFFRKSSERPEDVYAVS